MDLPECKKVVGEKRWRATSCKCQNLSMPGASLWHFFWTEDKDKADRSDCFMKKGAFAKGNSVSYLGSRNRKRTCLKYEKAWGLVNRHVPMFASLWWQMSEMQVKDTGECSMPSCNFPINLKQFPNKNLKPLPLGMVLSQVREWNGKGVVSEKVIRWNTLLLQVTLYFRVPPNPCHHSKKGSYTALSFYFKCFVFFKNSFTLKFY